MMRSFIKSLLALLLSLTFFYSNAQVITTVAGNGIAGYSGDGSSATSAQLNQPSGIAVDGAGNVYIADYNNSCVRKVDLSGNISTIAGTGTSGFSGDGGLATSAKLNSPATVAVDALGNIYIADFLNNRIRKINTSGIISTIAGTTAGFSGDGGPATSAQLNQPWGVAVDALGNVFIGDVLNARVRKINTSSIISTFAGTGIPSYSGDGGPATSANLYYPNGVAVDALGNLFLAEYPGHRVRKVNTSGIISTIAGTGVPGSAGDGGPATSAQLNGPPNMTIDASGNVYIADYNNDRVRKINTIGTISTFAGNGIPGFSGDGGSPGSAQLYRPSAIAVDGLGNILIVDSYNNRIRKVVLPSGISELMGVNSISTYPNPCHDELNIDNGKNKFENSEIEIVNYLGQTVMAIPFSNSIDVSGLTQGLYNLKITSQNREVFYSKFAKE